MNIGLIASADYQNDDGSYYTILFANIGGADYELKVGTREEVDKFISDNWEIIATDGNYDLVKSKS